MFLSCGNSIRKKLLMTPTAITIAPIMIIPFPHYILAGMELSTEEALYICAPMISPTLAFDAQHPISSPLPLLGNQLLMTARLTAHPTDYKVPSIILKRKYSHTC
jgi:hypothetical protein